MSFMLLHGSVLRSDAEIFSRCRLMPPDLSRFIDHDTTDFVQQLPTLYWINPNRFTPVSKHSKSFCQSERKLHKAAKQAMSLLISAQSKLKEKEFCEVFWYVYFFGKKIIKALLINSFIKKWHVDVKGMLVFAVNISRP